MLLYNITIVQAQRKSENADKIIIIILVSIT